LRVLPFQTIGSVSVKAPGTDPKPGTWRNFEVVTIGIVRKTALQITRGADSDVEKVHRIYDWIIVSTYREPKVRGCGIGDIKALLETGDLGRKCADINALFVGLCRAAGIPARDAYGLRLAPSAFGYRELGGNSANLKSAQRWPWVQRRRYWPAAAACYRSSWYLLDSRAPG
jgi:transglutaminase-like putative cysteine protease